jgi:hypothetical protein
VVWGHTVVILRTGWGRLKPNTIFRVPVVIRRFVWVIRRFLSFLLFRREGSR